MLRIQALIFPKIMSQILYLHMPRVGARWNYKIGLGLKRARS